MVEQCDVKGCPAEARVIVAKTDLMLHLCGHDFDDRMIMLFMHGWAVRDDTRPALRRAEAERK